MNITPRNKNTSGISELKAFFMLHREVGNIRNTVRVWDTTLVGSLGFPGGPSSIIPLPCIANYKKDATVWVKP